MPNSITRHPIPRIHRRHTSHRVTPTQRQTKKITLRNKKDFTRKNYYTKELSENPGPPILNHPGHFPRPTLLLSPPKIKRKCLRTNHSYSQTLSLDQESREELEWWLKNAQAWNGRAIFGEEPELVIDSDASLEG